MRIGVDLTFLFFENYAAGIGQYTFSLLQAMQKIGKLQSFTLLVRDTFKDRAKALCPDAEIVPVQMDLLAGTFLRTFNKNLLDNFYYSWRLVPQKIKNLRLDMLFYPFQAISVRAKVGVPVIITVHDLQFKHFPEQYRPWYLKLVENRFDYFLHQADGLVTISDFAKEDILRHYPDLNKSSLYRIYNPVSFRTEEEKPYPISGDYILSVNSIKRHKNAITLLKAFDLLRDRIPHRLVLVGQSENAGGTIQDYIDTHNLRERVILTGYIGEAEKNYLYRHASLFVSPSLHEGFGLTPIEAMLKEIPVITTRETSLYEVTKGLAHYYAPPLNAENLAETIRKVLADPPAKEELLHKKELIGREYLDTRIAADYWDVFEQIHAAYQRN